MGEFWASGFWATGFWADGFWGVGVEVGSTLQVRATGDGYFAREFKREGDLFYLTDPHQWSPYWMELVGAIPEGWLAIMRTFDPNVDRAILKQPTEVQNVPADFAALLS